MPAVRRAERCMTSCPTTAHTTGAGKTPAFPSRNPPAAKRRPCGKLFRKGSGFPAAAAAGPHAADGCAGEGGNRSKSLPRAQDRLAAGTARPLRARRRASGGRFARALAECRTDRAAPCLGRGSEERFPDCRPVCVPLQQRLRARQKNDSVGPAPPPPRSRRFPCSVPTHRRAKP